MQTRKNSDSVQLTKRQREVLSLAAKGNTYEGIASGLCISEDTVRGHLAAIRLKLRTRNTLGAVTIAISQGMIAS